MGNGASLEGFDLPPHGGFDLPQRRGAAPGRDLGRDFYAVLSLGREASEDEIKKGYRKAAVKWHPDKWSSKPEAEQKEAEEKFKAAAEAYEVLSDKSKKEVYDRYGEEGLKAGRGGGSSTSSGIVPMGGFPGGVFMSSGGGPGGGVSFSFSCGGAGMNSGRAEQIFASFFSGGDPFGFDDDDDTFFDRRAPPRRAAPRPPPLRADLLPREANVQLVDLSNAALNEARGVVVGFDEEKRRYNVRLLAGGNEIAVKPLNVREVISGARIDRPTAVQLGFVGAVVGSATYDTPSSRYVVSGLPGRGSVVLDAAAVQVKPENLILPAETRVTAAGLKARPELNGQPGKVVSADGERYVVEMAGTAEQVRLKFGNVVALHGYNPWVGEFG